jgi:hypothetical protein
MIACRPACAAARAKGRNDDTVGVLWGNLLVGLAL